MIETILKAYGIWETIVAKDGVATNKKKENTSKAIIFQTLPQDILMQVSQYSTAKEVWDSIKVKNLGADLVQKARLQTLRSELDTLRIKPNEKVTDFGGKLSSIMAKFKGLGETLEDKVLVRKLLNSAPKKFLPIVATIEQYQDLDEMSFEEAIGRLTIYEERIKSQDTLEENDQDKLLMASSNSKSYGKWRGKDFNKEGKESMKWKNNPNACRASTSQGTKDKSKLRCYECGKDFNKEGKESMKWKNNTNARRASTSQGTKDKSKLRCYECDKSVIQEGSRNETKSGDDNLSFKTLIEDKDDDDADDWLKEDNSENMTATGTTTIPLKNDEDVLFSDLDEDDAYALTNYKNRKSQVKKVVCIPALALANNIPTGEVVPSDLWAWRLMSVLGHLHCIMAMAWAAVV
nr:zinc finger, CCHC-type [Tanacetum cinerariifolium]